MTESVDSVQASAGQFSFATDFSRWYAPFTMTLSRLQPDFHDSITAKRGSNKAPFTGLPREAGFRLAPWGR